MGGLPPLGYDVKDRKLIVNEAEAATVRMIFRRYLELGSVRALKAALDEEGVVSKQRKAADGSPYGGKSFSRGALYLMLQNRIYLGEIVHKGAAYPGEHPSIIDEDLWSSVQRRLEANGVERRERHASAPPNLLTGVLFDADSQAMTPTYAIKKGVRYRYYVSHHLVTGTRGEEGNGQTSGQRIPAANLEALAVQRLRSFFADSALARRSGSIGDAESEPFVARGGKSEGEALDGLVASLSGLNVDQLRSHSRRTRRRGRFPGFPLPHTDPDEFATAAEGRRTRSGNCAVGSFWRRFGRRFRYVGRRRCFVRLRSGRELCRDQGPIRPYRNRPCRFSIGSLHQCPGSERRCNLRRNRRREFGRRHRADVCRRAGGFAARSLRPGSIVGGGHDRRSVQHTRRSSLEREN